MFKYVPTTDDWRQERRKFFDNCERRLRRTKSMVMLKQAGFTPKEKILGTGVYNNAQIVTIKVGQEEQHWVVKTPSYRTYADVLSFAEEEQQFIEKQELPPNIKGYYASVAFKDHIGTQIVYGKDASYFFIITEDNKGTVISPYQQDAFSMEMLSPIYSYRHLSRYLPGEIFGDAFSQTHCPIKKTKMAIAAAKALKEIHAKGIIHRDIKSNNLKYDETTDTAYYLDFDEHLKIGEPARELPRSSEAYHWAPESRGLCKQTMKVSDESEEETEEIDTQLKATVEMDIYALGQMFLCESTEWAPNFPNLARFIKNDVRHFFPHKRPSLDEIIGFFQCELWYQTYLIKNRHDEDLYKEILANTEFCEKQPIALNLLQIYAKIANNETLKKRKKPEHDEIIEIIAHYEIDFSDEKIRISTCERIISDEMIEIKKQIDLFFGDDTKKRDRILVEAIRRTKLHKFLVNLTTGQETHLDPLGKLFNLNMRQDVHPHCAIFIEYFDKMQEFTDKISMVYQECAVLPRSDVKKDLFKTFAKKLLIFFLKNYSSPLDLFNKLTIMLEKLPTSEENGYPELRAALLTQSKTLLASRMFCAAMIDFLYYAHPEQQEKFTTILETSGIKQTNKELKDTHGEIPICHPCKIR